MNSRYFLKGEHLSKNFPGVRALDDVFLEIEAGKVLAVTGENGAGKSTLMKVLMGMCAPDSGSLYLHDQPVTFHNVHDAIRAGFSMIHQELSAFPELTIAQNIFIGKEPAGFLPGSVNQQKMNRESARLLGELGMDVDVTKKMKELRVAEMQMVEIAKAISNEAELIIMDEPTSAISGREVEILFRIIKDLTKRGIAIVYISHKMEEIIHIADDVMVMRDGRSIARRPCKGLDHDELISWIVGREITAMYGRKERDAGDVILSVSNLSGKKFTDISFELRRGEILGFAGLMGAGRTEIVHALYGIEPTTSGRITLKSGDCEIRSPRDAIQAGISLVSEDRKLYGLVLSLSVKKNITLSSLHRLSRSPFIDMGKEDDVTKEQVSSLGIKMQSGEQAAKYLSGGNQQKVVIAKALLNDSDIVILDEPTRGIDVQAKSEIYKTIRQLAALGKGIILISSELPEVLGLSDRILVIHEGRIKSTLDGATATQEQVMTEILSANQYLSSGNLN